MAIAEIAFRLDDFETDGVREDSDDENLENIFDQKTCQELVALERLLELRKSEKCRMFRSRVVRAEWEKTRDTEQRSKLQGDYEVLDQIPQDERPLGSFNITLEQTGVVSWVQRIDSVAERVKDLFGRWMTKYRIVRRSNVYHFRDPHLCRLVILFGPLLPADDVFDRNRLLAIGTGDRLRCLANATVK
jgi:hypothetical protein